MAASWCEVMASSNRRTSHQDAAEVVQRVAFALSVAEPPVRCGRPRVVAPCQDAGVANNFPSDFYVTCATVIPVLFLAIVVQGGTYESMLRSAKAAAQKLPRRQRDYAAAELLPAAAYLALIAGLIGEIGALIVLYNGSDTRTDRTVVLVATLFLLVIVAAGPAWKWFQVQDAINRQRLRVPVGTVGDPAYGYGAGKRPLWNARDKDAERIRIALRGAGSPEFGEGRDGFVVEGGQGKEPFYVACTIDDDSRSVAELRSYRKALAAAGFRVAPDVDIDHVLQVWDASTLAKKGSGQRADDPTNKDSAT